MLNSSVYPIEVNIQKAAVECNWQAYKLYFDMLEEQYNGRIPREKIISIYCGIEGSILTAILENTTPHREDMHYIAGHILDILQNIDYPLAAALLRRPYDEAGEERPVFVAKKMYDWARQNRVQTLLEHPLVKEELRIDEIRTLVFNNQITQALELIAQYKLDKRKVFNEFFFYELENKYKFASEIKVREMLDSAIAELLERKEIPLSLTFNFGHSRTMCVDYPKLLKTDAFQIINPMCALEKESYDDDEQYLVALRLIDEYLDDVSEGDKSWLTTPLLKKALEIWMEGSAEEIQERQQIVLTLLNHGAQISLFMPELNIAPFYLNPITAANPHYCIHSIIENNMLEALRHPTVIEQFKQCSYADQIAILKKAGKFGTGSFTGLASNDNLEMIKLLISHLKQPQTLFNKNRYTFDDSGYSILSMITELNSWKLLAIDKENGQYSLKIFALLMAHGVVEGIETVLPGSYSLDFPNPATGENYDLHQFIMDNPVLKSGFRKQKRDEELLSLYALTKAILAKETRSEAAVEKLKKRSSFVVKGKDGQKVVYNRYLLKQNMQDTIGEMRASIMKYVDPSDLPEEVRYTTATKLEQIARQHLNK